MAGKKKSKAEGVPSPGGRRELIVMMRDDAGVRASAGRFEATAAFPVSTMKTLLTKHGATLRPLFGPSEERVQESLALAQAETGRRPEDLSTFYIVEADDARLDELREGIAREEAVEAAYVKPAVELPVLATTAASPVMAPAAGVTPNYVPRQLYLGPAPAGVDAQWAWTIAGGTGKGVRIIDIEGDWRFTHEDLLQGQAGIIADTNKPAIKNDKSWRNHGTAVLGEYSGDASAFGIKGISYDALAMAVSHGNLGSAEAINMAASKLKKGDVILLEMHRPGPRFNYADRPQDQRGYIAVEWWPDDFVAIANATRRGIIVVEAAGNGAEDLDDPLYEKPHPHFDKSWRNPFQRQNRDSGAIVVGAGAPPPGTHSRNHGPDRSRLDFSNYGSVVDCQGWGREVTTCGYGDLQGGTNEDIWYTDVFSGTSSASPIVTGVVACLQGMADARNVPRIAPLALRNLLRTTGSAQQDAPNRPASQRIGNRPDLRQLAQSAFGGGGPASPAVAVAAAKPKRRGGKRKAKGGRQRA